MGIKVEVRGSKGELEEMTCQRCSSIFYINPRKKRTVAYCPVCGFKIKVK